MTTAGAAKLCAVIMLGVTGLPELCAQLPAVPAGATAVAQGLFGPRGLKFGPDGNLYVALSGPGGTNSTADVCPQSQISPSQGGPYTNGNTASIVKVDRKRNVSTVAGGFPSALSTHPDVEGVADIAFLGGQLYAVTAGGGCSHGTLVPQMIAKINRRTGKWTMLANMSAALAAHPAAAVGGDFDPDGLFYNLIAANGKLYAVEANHGQIWSITPSGQVAMVTDISKAEGHIVPTAAVALSNGLLGDLLDGQPDSLLVGNLGLFPITPDSEVLTTLRPDCNPLQAWFQRCDPGTMEVAGTTSPGLTAVVAMDWGPDGALYVLELSSPQPGDAPPFFPTPGEGKVVRVKGHGMAQDVITGLSVPTGMTFGPDGALYVSNWGAADAPIGQILRFNVH